MADSLQSVAPEGAARWYACYTKARAEKRVHGLLQERGIDTFLPLMPRVSQWKDRKKVVDFPLFPSYVFGRFDLAQAHRVLSVPGVATLVRAAGRAVPIPDGDIENVRLFAQALQEGGTLPERRPFFADGEWVEVTAGPFAGVRGVVVEQRGRRRVLIGLKAIGQGLEIDIDTRSLRAIASPA
jgi:transcription antitermination factor NusG